MRTELNLNLTRQILTPTGPVGVPARAHQTCKCAHQTCLCSSHCMCSAVFTHACIHHTCVYSLDLLLLVTYVRTHQTYMCSSQLFVFILPACGQHIYVFSCVCSLLLLVLITPTCAHCTCLGSKLPRTAVGQSLYAVTKRSPSELKECPETLFLFSPLVKDIPARFLFM